MEFVYFIVVSKSNVSESWEEFIETESNYCFPQWREKIKEQTAVKENCRT